MKKHKLNGGKVIKVKKTRTQWGKWGLWMKTTLQDRMEGKTKQRWKGVGRGQK